MVGSGLGKRDAAGPDGVGVGVVVWEVSVVVGVGWAMRFCVGCSDADLACMFSGMISIDVAVEFGPSSCARELELM